MKTFWRVVIIIALVVCLVYGTWAYFRMDKLLIHTRGSVQSDRP